jgi:hypothetical protein
MKSNFPFSLNSSSAGSPLRRLMAPALAALALFFVGASARGQVGEVYVNLTDIEIKEYSNAVAATIHTDGDTPMDIDWDQLRIDGQLVADIYGNYVYSGKRWHRYQFYVVNARSKLASGIIKVDKYPLSHIEIRPELPQWIIDKYGTEVGLTIIFETYDDIDYRSGLALNQMPEGGLDFRVLSGSQGLVVIFYSGRQLKTGGAAPSEDAFLASVKPELQVRSEQEGLEVKALNAGLQDLAQELSRVSGESVSAASGAKERISLVLHHRTLSEVLEAVARGYGLVLARDESGYHLAEAAAVAADGLPGETAVYSARYLSARRLRNSLPDFLLPYTRIDDNNNLISLTGPGPLLEHARAQLAQIDRPGPNLWVEMTAVEFSSSEEAAAALALGLTRPGFQGGFASAEGDVNFSNLGTVAENFDARLEALVTQGKASIQAKKRLLLLNGESAEIFAGQERNLIIESNATGSIQARIQQVDIGARLKVTATAGGGEELWLTLNPEVNNLIELDPRTGEPVVGVRSASSTLRIREGDLVAVGGVSLTQGERSRTRIPGLGKIPLLGGLFRSRREKQNQTETVFLVSARKAGSEERGESWGNADSAR